jgi:surface carbohydrate biosynthesis protein
LQNGLKRLFVPIETKVREFHGKLFFALTAAENGFEVFLGGQQQMHAHIAEWSPGIYVDKSIAETKRNWCRYSRSLGNVMCSWDEEGLVVFSEETYFRLRICREVYEQIKCFFAWGPSEAGAITSRITDGTCTVHATGNPRFDMLRPELRGFYDDAVTSLKDRFGRMLLVNTNFAFANFFLGDEKVKEVYRAYSISEDPTFFSGWADAQRESFALFREMLPVLRARFHDHTIVIRPHPSEHYGPWQELASSLPGVTVHGEGNVYEWILASEALIHFNCTTGIEAYFLGVPAISLRRPGHEAFHQPLPNQLSHICNDVDSLILLLSQILDKGQGFPRLLDDEKRQGIARYHIEGMTGDYAATRIVRILQSIEPTGIPFVDKSEIPVPLVKRVWRQVLRLVRRKRGPDPADVAYSLQKFPGLNLDEVESCVKRFSQITGSFDSIIVQQMAENCFRICAK